MQGSFVSKTMEQVFHIALEEPEVVYTLVFTGKTNLWDSEPLEPRGKRKCSDFDCITKRFRLSDGLIERFIEHGWKIWLPPVHKNKKDLPLQPHLEVHCRFAVRHDNKSIQVGVQVIAPETKMCRRMYINAKCFRPEYADS